MARQVSRNWRLRLLELYGVLASLVIGALIFERHRAGWHADFTDWGPWHNLAVEGYLVPFVLVAVVVPACWWGRRRAPRGLLAASLGLAAGLTVFMTMLLAHTLEETQQNKAGDVVLFGALALVLGSFVLFVAEPLAAHLAREGRGPALRDVAVTGGGRTARSVVIVVLCVLAAVLALLLVVERHDEISFRDYEAPPRHEWFIVDTYGFILLGPVAVLASALRARRGFPHGVFAGTIAFLAGVAMLTTWLVMHTITHKSPSTNWALLTMVALVFVGPAFAIVDAALHARARRRTDRPGPTLPAARISS
jgi:hypothetical protein